jgi:phage tail tape-measure protein
MKSLAVAAVTLALIAAAPREAPAQETGLTAGAVAATIAGAAVGGAVGYYYLTGVAATVIGVVAGGAIGDWWYMAATSRDGMMPGGKMKMRYADTPPPLFQLIGDSGRSQPGLHTAAFSAAAD